MKFPRPSFSELPVDGVTYPGSFSDARGKIAVIKHNGYVLLAPSVAQSGRGSEPGAYEVVYDRDPVDAACSSLDDRAHPPSNNAGMTPDASTLLRIKAGIVR